MFNKILVPLDGSELAERALAPAFALAQQAEGGVLLLRVAAPQPLVASTTPLHGDYGLTLPVQTSDEAQTEAESYLKIVRQDKAPHGLSVWLEAVKGGVAEAIVDTAADIHIDLIVMSSHGYSGITRWVLGSVAEKVLHKAPCPVLVVRSPRPLRHLLVPLDGSALSEAALLPALDVAASLGAEVTLLRAVHTAASEAVEQLDQIEKGLGQRVVEDMREAAGRYLRGLAEKHRRAGLALKTAVVDEPAAASILDYTETHAVDLIAMSTHGRTGIPRWIYGSVTEKVLHGDSHSMLIIRPQGGS